MSYRQSPTTSLFYRRCHFPLIAFLSYDSPSHEQHRSLPHCFRWLPSLDKSLPRTPPDVSVWTFPKLLLFRLGASAVLPSGIFIELLFALLDHLYYWVYKFFWFPFISTLASRLVHKVGLLLHTEHFDTLPLLPQNWNPSDIWVLHSCVKRSFAYHSFNERIRLIIYPPSPGGCLTDSSIVLALIYVLQNLLRQLPFLLTFCHSRTQVANHFYQVSIPECRTSSFQSSFIPLTVELRSIFFSTVENLSVFKGRVIKLNLNPMFPTYIHSTVDFSTEEFTYFTPHYLVL